MYLSQLFIPITKDLPAEAKIKSHQLMLQTGMIRQSSAGIYSWLPLGFKVMKKIEQIVREEQNSIGAQEMLMPTIQSAEIWKESGRYDDYGEEMLRIKDRQGREMLYGPTNEELITDIFRSSVKSYKSLPQILYHIQWKFRDEIRPRFGVMRCKEFFMKDAYSFDLTDDDAKKSYNKMFFSYLKTFKRLGLKAIPMAADTGPIGGDLSHEFIIISNTGESDIYFDSNILNEGNKISDINYNDDLKSIVENFKNYYSASDDKHDKSKFDEMVLKEKQMNSKGIEVGHIFHFGTKYSNSMKANVLDSDGKEKTVHMGSYGIGISRLVGAIIESSHDEKGIIWPDAVSPFKIGVINLKPKDYNISSIANKFYDQINEKSEVLLDDKDDNAGVKFSRMDLIGLPHQIIIGNKAVSDSQIEYKNRKSGDTKLIRLDEISNLLKEINI